MKKTEHIEKSPYHANIYMLKKKSTCTHLHVYKISMEGYPRNQLQWVILERKSG